jgi:hypothetical protein
MRYLPSLFLIGLMFCCASRSNNITTGDRYDSLANAIVGSRYDERTNKDGRYVLLISNNEDPRDSTRTYVVIRKADTTRVIEGKINRGGYARWSGLNAVKIFSIPRHVKHVPDSAMYIREILLE